MPKFKITYYDLETNNMVEEIAEFHDFRGRATQYGKPIGPELHITARESAEDYGYSLSDKGHVDVEEII